LFLAIHEVLELSSLNYIFILYISLLPTTSAPSEHVFSIVSTAKDHARLAPQTVNKLVFYTMPFQLLHSLTIVNGEEGSGNRV
jgi:uncharacterized membrane protein